jgi:lysophospholipase L1-like esterase
MWAAAVPTGALLVLLVEVLMARSAPELPDRTPLQHDGHVGGAGPALRMVWLGDSTAAGVGATSAETALPRRVARGLGRPAEVTSLAVSGARVNDVVLHQAGRLPALDPDVVLVSIGANDVINLSSRAGFKATYELLTQAVPDDALLVILGVPDMAAPPRLAQPLRALTGLRGRQLATVSREAATEAGAVFVDIAGETGPAIRSDPDRYLAVDRWHPSDDGYALWAAAVLEQLVPALERREERTGAHR